ncbi:MAG: SDR family oxidoreductase [Alphaproteobacteria bacterium]|nr:SDR family oxidoreductase [Alphaproteobacteria bacterium]
MDLELAGKKVIISAATRGVGRAIAERFLREGAVVAICGRTARSGEPSTTEPEVIRNDLPGDGVEEAVAAMSRLGTVYGSVVDCGYAEQVTAWVEEAARRMGGIDVAVSNASALGGIPRSRKGWDISYNVDMMSAVAMWDAAYPHLKQSDQPAWVQVSTISAVEYHAFAGSSQSYGAMKAALINYTSQLAYEFMGEGIRCNSVSPGPIYIKGGSWDWLEQNMPDYVDHNIAKQPSGRFGRAEEVADVVAFLASPRASWVTGESVVIDGGYTKHIKF